MSGVVIDMYLSRQFIRPNYMSSFHRYLQWPYLIILIGSGLVLFAAAQAGLAIGRGDPVTATVLDLVYVGGSGGVLVYAGYWLPSSYIPQAYYRRLIGWVLTGVVVMFGFLILRDFHPQVSVEWTTGTQAIALMIGTVGGLLVGIQEITNASRTTQLETLNRATRELFTVETRDAVITRGVELSREVLDHDAIAIHLYDEETGGLAPTAAADQVYELVGELPTFTSGNSIAWDVYQDGTSRLVRDVGENPDRYNADTPVASELHVPLGEHGILIATSMDADEFDQYDLILGGILAENIATALRTVEQTAKLRSREQELVDQNERLEQFTSIASHDLRNPLNVAQGRIELARETTDSEHLAKAGSALDRMEELITDLLALARDDDSTLDLETVDVAVLAKNCWQNVETTEATLVTDSDRTVRADELRLRQLFENLIRNSVEHGGPGTTVTVDALDDGFYIEDDGPGIPESRRIDVFQAGYTSSKNGTGFGLSIVKQIADAHDWDVTVTGGSAGGARFEITGVGSTAG